MKIQGSDKIRGELVLSSVKKIVRANEQVTIPDKDYHNDDIQTMLRAKIIFVVQGGEGVPEGEMADEDRVQIHSLTTKPLTIASLPFPLLPNEAYFITRRQYETDAVQQAVTLGLCDKTDATYTASMPLMEKLPVPEVDANEDNADHFKRTGHATTFMPPPKTTPKNSFVYDPNKRSGRADPPSQTIPKGMHAYDPANPPALRASPTLPVRGQIHNRANRGYDDPIPQKPTPQQQQMQKRAGGRRIRPIGGGENDLGGDGVDIEML